MDAVIQVLFNATPHPYLVVRPDPLFEIAAVNDRYLAATDTERTALVGRSLFDVLDDHSENMGAIPVEDLRVSLERVLRHRAPDAMGVRKRDVPNEIGGFDVHYWSPVNTPVLDADGGVAFIIHSFDDVTDFVLSQERAARESAKLVEMVAEIERRKAELAKMNERLKELDQVKTAFFANASHEFRTPLTLILGPIEDLLESEDLDPPRRALLQTALRNALLLQRQVAAMLDLSRIEAGMLSAALEPVDLAVLTRDLASNFTSACERAGIGFAVDCPPLPGFVRVDWEMWETIVLNLLSNAFKYTLAGEISLRLCPTRGGVELVVRDTGEGIPADQVARIFERFHRVKGARGRSTEGSGIGLALVQELARLHGGTVSVESAVGRGSAFAVWLPVGAFEAAPETAGRSEATQSLRARGFIAEALRWLPETRSPPPPFETESRGTRPRIVLADDNPDMREYLTGLLDRAGYQVQTVSDGEAAFAVCVVTPSALLLSDVMMPNLDGLELTRRLRADPRTAAIPVLLLSARAGETARIEGFLAGADEYIEKPFGARELVARVAAAVRLARARTELAQRERQIAVLARLSSVVASAMDAIITVDAQQRVMLFNAAAEHMFGWSAPDAMGRPLGDFIPSRFRAAHESHVRDFGENGVTDRAMGRLGDLSALRADGVEFPIEASISQAVFEGEKLFTVILRDVSARKAAADTQRVLIGELDHRVKNTLATVQAIARQTLDINKEPGASFNGRLHALASAHTLLTRRNWQGADLNSLIREQVAFGPTSTDERIVCTGPEVFLSPQGALHLGLVLHELGTNARKFGSLSDAQGRLDVNWEVSEGDVSRWLKIVWIESCGPPVGAPAGKGFGAWLIEQSLTHALRGQTRLDFAPAGLKCEIRLPLSVKQL